MTQKLECQRCGEFIDTVLTDKSIIIYHTKCWVEFQQETIAVARGKQWKKLGKTTEYYEDDGEVNPKSFGMGEFRGPVGKDLTLDD